MPSPLQNTPIGIRSRELRYCAESIAVEVAQELEGLGVVLWLPALDGGVFKRAQSLLQATSSLTVAISVAGIGAYDAETVCVKHHSLASAYPGRLITGIGLGHPPASSRHAEQPATSTLSKHLDAIDECPMPLPRHERIVAALGPQMAAIAAQRSLGVHPFLVNAPYSARLRQQIGPGPVLAPQVALVAEAEPEAARAIARSHLGVYRDLPAYRRSWLRQGYGSADIEQLSDRLVDDLVVWGETDAITARIADHRLAGADHVCLEVVGATDTSPKLFRWDLLVAAARAASDLRAGNHA